MNKKVEIMCGPKGSKKFWIEDFQVPVHYTLADIVDSATQLIDNFNAEERQRYGDKHTDRVFYAVMATDFQQVGGEHNWQKQNLVTLSDRTGCYDKMKCTACGCEARRYGLGDTYTFVGKFKHSKWAKCNG